MRPGSSKGVRVVSDRLLRAGLAAGALAIGLTLLSVLAPLPRLQAQTGFYVAIAPYISQTHPCTYHVKGSCQAELKAVTFRYWLRSTDGALIRPPSPCATCDPQGHQGPGSTMSRGGGAGRLRPRVPARDDRRPGNPDSRRTRPDRGHDGCHAVPGPGPLAGTGPHAS